jgi:acetylornithine deacetylase/succinyl-diaminopimelate desuccinylase-like protein
VAVDGPEPCGVLMVGHLDTVPADPAGWTLDPFAGQVVDGSVWGRGSVDMKGRLGAMVAALAALHDVAPERAAGAQLYAVAGEEELARIPGVTGEVNVLNEAAPVTTDLDDPLVAAALAAASVADSGRTDKPSPRGAAFFSDASVLQPALAGVPTILFGPGAMERMHQIDEHVAVDDLHTAARCYAALLIERAQPPY